MAKSRRWNRRNGYIGIPTGGECFAECTKLDNYEDIPDYWKQLGSQ